MPSPEAEARQEIDRQPAACGWEVQHFGRMNLSAAPGIAFRKFRLASGPVDYLLYADGKVIAVVEVKPEGHMPTGVEIQSDRYTKGLADLVLCRKIRPVSAASCDCAGSRKPMHRKREGVRGQCGKREGFRVRVARYG